MATIITLDDKVEEVEIYSSFIPSELLAAQEFIARCDSGGAINENTSCIINDYINNY